MFRFNTVQLGENWFYCSENTVSQKYTLKSISSSTNILIALVGTLQESVQWYTIIQQYTVVLVQPQ